MYTDTIYADEKWRNYFKNVMWSKIKKFSEYLKKNIKKYNPIQTNHIN